MRSDISKVVVERPRTGLAAAKIAVRRRRRHNNDPRGFEDAPQTQSMGRWGYTESKSLTDFLSPLEGFFRKNAGRRWDDVYSEMRAHLSPSTTLQKHIFDHVSDFVIKDVFIGDDGELYCLARYGGRMVPLVEYRQFFRGSQFFVHPVSGLLLPFPRKKVAPTKEQPRPKGWQRLRAFGPHGVEDAEVIVQGRAVYVKYEGIWYHVDMRPVPKEFPWGSAPKRITVETPFGAPARWNYGPRDWLLGVFLTAEPNRWSSDPGTSLRARVGQVYGSLGYYAYGRGHQLNSKTLRRLGVQNDPVG